MGSQQIIIANAYHLFSSVNSIAKFYNKLGQITGREFNVFKILNLQSYEVRMHSAFIAELLNPSGSHGQKSKYLELFLKEFNIEDFDTNNIIVEVEKHIGPLNDDETAGGRLDIVISNKLNNRIIIENKIYARDQKNQLLRYYNFDPNSIIFYLTLFGTQPDDKSVLEKIPNDRVNFISYSENLISWLNRCFHGSASLPIIRESILQYINLIKELTNQNTMNDMDQGIKALFLQNPNFIDSFENCVKVLNSIVIETQNEFNNLMNEIFPQKLIPIDSELNLKVFWNIDGDGFYIGYSLLKNDKFNNNSELGLKLTAKLKDIEPSMYSNNLHLGWFNPKPFKRHQQISNLDKNIILKMNSDKEFLNEFANSILDQEIKITNLLKEYILKL